VVTGTRIRYMVHRSPDSCAEEKGGGAPFNCFRVKWGNLVRDEFVSSEYLSVLDCSHFISLFRCYFRHAIFAIFLILYHY
jgi:hypothetical protein